MGNTPTVGVAARAGSAVEAPGCCVPGWTGADGSLDGGAGIAGASVDGWAGVSVGAGVNVAVGSRVSVGTGVLLGPKPKGSPEPQAVVSREITISKSKLFLYMGSSLNASIHSCHLIILKTLGQKVCSKQAQLLANDPFPSFNEIIPDIHSIL